MNEKQNERYAKITEQIKNTFINIELIRKNCLSAMRNFEERVHGK